MSGAADQDGKAHPLLSPRETEVVVLVVEGLTDAQIAERLTISARTVHSHVAAAIRKTGTRTRTQLAVHAVRTGLVALDDA